MATAGTAAVAAIAFVALYAGHQVGDHVVQTSRDANTKGAPTAGDVHPWTGWAACLRHVGTYTLTQAVALALARLVAPLSLAGVLSALVVSAGTHAVIDRRWIVRLLVAAKGCQDWREAPYLIDQSLHVAALLVAAVLAALATNLALATSVAVLVAALVGLCATAEKAVRVGASRR
jgi:hypothetical protein